MKCYLNLSDFESKTAAVNDLTFNALSKVFNEKLDVSKVDMDILKVTSLADKSDSLNNAALIFSDQNDLAGIEIKRYGYLDSDILSQKQISNISVLTSYNKAVRTFEQYYEFERPEDNNKLISIIPKSAFKDALIHAIILRDWDNKDLININMYQHSIEITFPYHFPNAINLTEFIDGKVAIIRNRTISNLFFTLRYITRYESHFINIKESYKDYSINPIVRLSDSKMTFTLPVINEQPKITKDASVIMEALKSGYVLSSSELVERTPFNKSKVIRLVNHLCESGYVYKVGTGRGTKYRV